MTCESDDVKRQASGHWPEILHAAGLPSELRDGRGHPCPKCGGTDRFTVFNDCDQTGGVMCRQCFSKGNGDGFAAVMWLRDCTFPEAVEFVAQTLGLAASDVCPESQRSPGTSSPEKPYKLKRPKRTWPTSNAAIAALEAKRGTRTADWTYHGADGQVVGVVLRWNLSHGGKDILPITKVDDGWQCVAMAEPRPLYRLPEVIQSDVVFILEGEKACDAGVSIGLNCTTNSGGSSAAAQTDWRPLAGKAVVISPDNDAPGVKHTEIVAGIVTQLDPPATVRILDLKDDWPELPEKGDLADWCEAHDAVEPETLRERIAALVVKAEPWQPCPSPAQPQASRLSLLDLKDDDDDWPAPLESEAFHGVAGEFVRQVLPETEADEAALLFHVLTYVAAMMGRARYFPVSGTSHHARLFSVAVGNTSSGRKGTALDCVEYVMRMVDAQSIGDESAGNLSGISLDDAFCETNVVNGLTSGAGIIWRLRDEQQRKNVIDTGVSDKRLLIVESEFGGVLRVCQRKENDLSAVLRDLWDGKTLRTLAKQEPAEATSPHGNFIAHITREELRATLSRVDTFNGFANRMLWYAVKRSKLLPDGGKLHLKDFSGLAASIRSAVDFAQTPGRMERSANAGNLWHEVYGTLSQGCPGVLGLVTTRATAQVLRLSMVYALLDCSNIIEECHLRAALACWQYCEDSARWAFGGSVGNRVADEILLALRDVAPRGQSSTELFGLFNRNKGSSDIREALGILSRCGLIRREEQKGNSPGRPTVVHFAT